MEFVTQLVMSPTACLTTTTVADVPPGVLKKILKMTNVKRHATMKHVNMTIMSAKICFVLLIVLQTDLMIPCVT